MTRDDPGLCGNDLGLCQYAQEWPEMARNFLGEIFFCLNLKHPIFSSLEQDAKGVQCAKRSMFGVYILMSKPAVFKSF